MSKKTDKGELVEGDSLLFFRDADVEEHDGILFSELHDEASHMRVRKNANNEKQDDPAGADAGILSVKLDTQVYDYVRKLAVSCSIQSGSEPDVNLVANRLLLTTRFAFMRELEDSVNDSYSGKLVEQLGPFFDECSLKTLGAMLAIGILEHFRVNGIDDLEPIIHELVVFFNNKSEYLTS